MEKNMKGADLKQKSKDQPDDGNEEVNSNFSEVIQIQPPINCEKGKHSFRLVAGMNAECAKCHTGYHLDMGSEVKNGHIYIHGSLVI